jgi:hypothetical protein
LIPIEPFDAEYSAVDSDHKRCWLPCRVIGVREGSLRYEMIALIPYDEDDGDMLCVTAVDEVRVKATQSPADAHSD